MSEAYNCPLPCVVWGSIAPPTGNSSVTWLPASLGAHPNTSRVSSTVKVILSTVQYFVFDVWQCSFVLSIEFIVREGHKHVHAWPHLSNNVISKSWEWLSHGYWYYTFDLKGNCILVRVYVEHKHIMPPPWQWHLLQKDMPLLAKYFSLL